MAVARHHHATAGLALALLVAVAPASHAAPKPKPKKITRTVIFRYQGFCGLSSAREVYSGACLDSARTRVEIGPKERYVTFAAADDSGNPIALHWYISSDQGTMTGCNGGAYKSLRGGEKLIFEVAAALRPDCVGVPTTGTLTVRLSNLP